MQLCLPIGLQALVWQEGEAVEAEAAEALISESFEFRQDDYEESYYSGF